MGKNVDPQVFFRVSKQQRAVIDNLVQKWNAQKGRATRSKVLRHIVMSYCESHLTKKERDRVSRKVEEPSFYVRVNPYEDADRFWSRASRLASTDPFFRRTYEILLRSDEPVLVTESWLMLARTIPGFSASPLLVNKTLPKRLEKYGFRYSIWTPNEIANLLHACAKRLHRSVSSIFRYTISQHLTKDMQISVATSNVKPLPLDGKRCVWVCVSKEDVDRWIARARAQGLFPRRLLLLHVCDHLVCAGVLSHDEEQMLLGFMAYLAMRLSARKNKKKPSLAKVMTRKTYAFSTRGQDFAA